MAGEKVPLVFFPRFTCLADTTSRAFDTTPVDVLGFENLVVTFWNGDVSGTSSPSLEFSVEQSADLTLWEDLLAAFTTTAGTPKEQSMTPSMRYVRCRARLNGTNPAATLWTVGYAQKTQM